MLEKRPHEGVAVLPARIGHVRTADARLRQRAFHGGGEMIVEAEVFLLRAAPVWRLGFVPQFPQPGRCAIDSVAFAAVACPGLDQRFPLPVILRWIERAAGHHVARQSRLHQCWGIRLRTRRQRLRHEARLHEGFDTGTRELVHDGVEARPVVTRVAFGIFGVDIGARPFQRQRAVAAGQQMVDPDADRFVAERIQFPQQITAFAGQRRAGFVVAEVVPDGADLSHHAVCMHGHRYRLACTVAAKERISEASWREIVMRAA